MQNLKIAVNSTDESLEIQQLLIDFGYVWESCGANIQSSLNISRYDFCTEHGFIRLTRNLKVETGAKLITLNVLREMVRLKKAEKEQDLISGADALRALADGEDVQGTLDFKLWANARDYGLDEFLDPNTSFKFRLKPKHHTVKLEIEVPAPFKPKAGEMVWCLNEFSENGYEARTAYESDDFVANLAYWRTEAEIKIVVEQIGKLKVVS